MDRAVSKVCGICKRGKRAVAPAESAGATVRLCDRCDTPTPGMTLSELGYDFNV